MKRKFEITPKVIPQGITENSLFTVIADWCKAGAGKKRFTLQMLSAFASGKGITAIEPLLDIFLADGNAVEIIVGVDRNGTDKAALRSLKALSAAYETQCVVRVFHAPSRQAIFHPKLYILRTPSTVSYVIGSPNLTCGGLSSNFESMLLFENCKNNSTPATAAISIWETFAKPSFPLKQDYLRELTQDYLHKLQKGMPNLSKEEFHRRPGAVSDLWQPISRLRLPRSTKVRKRAKLVATTKRNGFLLMDILRETRSTQMQIPLQVVTDFFRVNPRQEANLSISILTQTGISQPIIRTLVISQGPKKDRLMRRLEMPQIRGLERPLAVLFVHLPGRRRFAFHLIPRSSKSYKSASQILEREGQQGSVRRRFIVGDFSEKKWRTVKKLLP